MSVNVLDGNGNLKKIAHGFPESKFNVLRADIIENIESTDTASKNYAVGDYLIMANGQLVKVINAISEDSVITSNDVQAITVEEMIANKVDKVAGKDLSTNDYDDADKAKVGKIDETTTHISDNPISISGLKSNQLAVNPIITLEPIQDLHGQSKPYPAGGGKNLFDIDNVPFGTVSNDVWTFGGTTAQLDITFKANTQYAFSGYQTQSGQNKSVRLRVVYTDNTTENIFLVISTTRTAFTFVSDATKSISYVQAYYGSDSSATVAIEEFQIEEGNQATSYAPYENICPISGYDKIEALSCGKNLCDNSKNKTGGYYNAAGIWVSDNNYATSDLIPIVPNTTYRGHLYNKTTKESVAGLVYTTWEDETTRIAQYTTDTVTTESNAKYIRVRNYGADASYITNNNFLFALELGDISSTAYPEYNKATSISESLDQTVYGGTLDVRTGKFTVDRKIVDIGDLNWDYNSASNRLWFITPAQTDAESYSDETTVRDIVASAYSAASLNSIISDATLDGVVGLSNTKRIVVRNLAYSDATTFKTAMTGQKIVYKLDTPFTIQLTPHEISLLKDYAYVSTNGTSIALDYHNGEMASLADVEQLSKTVEESRRSPIRLLQEDITAYTTQGNQYTAPTDGYVTLNAKTATSGVIRVNVYDSTNATLAVVNMNVSMAEQQQALFIRKGFIIRVSNNSATGSQVMFRGMA